MTVFSSFVLAIIVASVTSGSLFAQSKCLSPDEAKALLLTQVDSRQDKTPNKKLHDELLKLVNKAERAISRGSLPRSAAKSAT